MWNKRNFGRARQTAHKRTELAGQWFDSKGESEMYLLLCDWLDKGEITAIDRQQTIKLTDANIGYRADFIITRPNGTKEVIEFKGLETEIFVLKKRLYKVYGPHKMLIYKKRGNKIYLDEVIDPVNEEKLSEK